ncbi:hypothetical protein CJ307_33860, partial [Klebsiella quasipneumoniae]
MPPPGWRGWPNGSAILLPLGWLLAAAQAQRRHTLEEAAAAGVVLLHNRQRLLPLAAQSGQRLAVIGPNMPPPGWRGWPNGSAILLPLGWLLAAAQAQRRHT